MCIGDYAIKIEMQFDTVACYSVKLEATVNVVNWMEYKIML